MKSCIEYINNSIDIGKMNDKTHTNIIKTGVDVIMNFTNILHKYLTKDICNIISRYSLYSFKYNIELHNNYNKDYIIIDTPDIITGFRTFPNKTINIEFNGLHVFDLTSDDQGKIKLDYPINKISMSFVTIIITGVNKIIVDAILFMNLKTIFINNKNEYYYFLKSHKKGFVYYNAMCLSDVVNGLI